ncbi:threonine/serine dehydratase [Xinfangfangia sp. D13-10-4-6]|uniref:threonine ammonia-lyase n=1 Tax=Pseudogemmobacter hezensis TaxID=2737662 RepID=UPI0015565769|nr:threonine/serine dehydratase [Pseudogemmobacter hezensis]NPD13809.1 threonine/serine dehydratase [Pseudogemmobacter hezensis]
MNITMIEAAAQRISGHIQRTPLLNAPLLDQIAGRRIFVKAESLQVTGSFKARGGWAAVSALPAGTKGVIAMSSGNHAQGVARAAKGHGIAAVILMPKDAPQVKMDNTRAWGAEVVLYDRATEDRDAIAQEIAQSRAYALIPPYDHPEVIAGQGTLGLEIAADAQAAGIEQAQVLVPCGGGGLSSGVALALAARAPDLRLRTVEPEGFDDMARSLAAGERLRNPRLSGSVCDAILTPTPGQMTFPILREHAGPGLVVSDAQALQAVALAFRHLRLVLEPGGAVALAAALFAKDLTADVICIASGGNVAEEVFRQALDQRP